MTGRHKKTTATPSRQATNPTPSEQIDNTAPHQTEGPQFAQPEPTPDATKFVVKHASDAAAYKEIDALTRAHELKPLAFPKSRGDTPEPILTLADVLGSNGANVTKAIETAGQIVFHALGDTGNTRSTEPQNEVADKLVTDFSENDNKDVPQFLFHLGDVIYSFGEAEYYYDQFYDP
jgi:hypothetical protein